MEGQDERVVTIKGGEIPVNRGQDLEIKVK